MENKKQKYDILDYIVFFVIIGFIVYIAGFSKYSILHNYDYSNVDIITSVNSQKK